MGASQQMLMAATGVAAPGQQVFTSSTTWTVPAGVTSISMVCVQQGGDGSATGTEVVYSAVTVCRAKNAARIGDGGGDGGAGGLGDINGVNEAGGGGGGGAGGYSGNGGAGGSYDSGAGGAAPAGGGGGGGGAGGPAARTTEFAGGGGGGVGLLGAGASGGATAAGPQGGNGGSSGGNGTAGVFRGNNTAAGNYGGGRGGWSGDSVTSTPGGVGETGGALSYKNSVAVTPGASVTITIPDTGAANGAVRIMWGTGRSYPNNAADV